MFPSLKQGTLTRPLRRFPFVPQKLLATRFSHTFFLTKYSSTTLSPLTIEIKARIHAERVQSTAKTKTTRPVVGKMGDVVASSLNLRECRSVRGTVGHYIEMRKKMPFV